MKLLSFALLFCSGLCMAKPLLLISNQLDGTVSVIDGTSKQLLHTLSGVGKTPAGVGYCGKQQFVVSSPDDQLVTLIDAKKPKVLRQWKVGSGPVGIDCSGSEAWVADWYENKVYKISLKGAFSPVSYPVGKAPSGVWIDVKRQRVYVASRDDNTLWVLDQNTGEKISVITVGQSPFGLGVTHDNNMLFVVNVRSGNVTVINLNRLEVEKNIAVGEWPYCVAFSLDDSVAYVTNQDDDSVSVIDMKDFQVKKEIPVGLSPEGIAVTGGRLWVVNWQQKSVSVIEEKTAESSEILVGKGPRSFGRFTSD